MNKRKLIEQCEITLKQNDVGGWTRPAPGLYPHQWLWDSCFVAIGLRHYDINRAQLEIDNLFRGQWSNGMIPHIIQGKGDYYADQLWNNGRSDLMPKDLLTSGITQPPLLAEAMVLIGEKLPTKKRQGWYRQHINQLLAYHEWLYRERDPHQVGLVALLHPWESGLDNSPSWMKQIHKHHKPLWISVGAGLGLTGLLEKMRKDTHFVPARERIGTIDALLLYYHVRKLIVAHYDNKKLLKSSRIATEDVAYNSILIRANQHLRTIAAEINVEIPGWLHERMRKAQSALDMLWDENEHMYFDRDFRRQTLLHEPTIGRYLPLYSGAVSKKRADQLAHELQKELSGTLYPIASVPITSPYFSHHRYWQGPTWVNTNWMIIDGLKRYGHTELAQSITTRTLELVSIHGPYEYFSPIDGTPAGAHQFSWSAALALDLAKTSQ